MPQAPKTLGYRSTKRPSERRPNSHQRGYNWEWRRATHAWIIEQYQNGNVNCALCGKLLGSLRRDVHVDHKIPPSRMGPVGSSEYRRWHEDQENWQLLCRWCNASKQNR